MKVRSSNHEGDTCGWVDPWLDRPVMTLRVRVPVVRASAAPRDGTDPESSAKG